MKPEFKIFNGASIDPQPEGLGNRLGRDILTIAISVDPENDIVEVIREYARKFNPQKGVAVSDQQRENHGGDQP